MRVLEAISDTNIGGAGRLLLERLAVSDRERIETAVLVPRNSMLRGKFEEQGIKVYLMDGCADRSFDARAIREISGVIRDFSPDIVNAHGCMSARISAFLLGVPTRIYTRHCAYEVAPLMRCFPIKQVVGLASSLISTDVIAVAHAARQNLTDMGVPSKKISVIVNGVGGFREYGESERLLARRELGIADGDFAVGICARIEKCKGHDCFLRAARQILRTGGAYKFLIIGEGSERKNAEALASALGISERVIFTGYTDDVERYMNCLDLNVNCSVGTETSSLALSEGMSIGKPCVASSYGGNTYMVRHGENGLIYEAGDFISLAQAVVRISTDGELYRRMSEKARERFALELNSRNMSEQVERLYFDCYRRHARA